jgi:DNA-binding MarR family transcriptional regulator
MSETIDKTKILRSVMKAIYNLADEDNYSVYEAEDIAEYLGLERAIIDEAIETLWDAGCLNHCMTEDDDGSTTYCLTDKAIDMVEMG